MTSVTGRSRPRDLRLDFFRGVCMFIIFVAHVPNNAWKLWIPARFGASDAAEIFVFCSGMASAIAFGAVFRDRGFWLGTARTAHRVWQVYWAHVVLFLVIAAMLVWFDQMRGDNFYTTRLWTRPFFEDPGPHLIGLLTLSYVPNYFDILPMYLVILVMMPIVVLLGSINRWYAFALIAGMWLLAQFDLVQFSAEVRPDTEREWFFNPFGWQLVFFTGFAFMAGWLPPPPVSRGLILGALAFLVLTSPISSPRVLDFTYLVAPGLGAWSSEIYPEIAAFREKSEFGILRYIHFLCLAYVAWVAVGPSGERLIARSSQRSSTSPPRGSTRTPGDRSGRCSPSTRSRSSGGYA